MGKKPAQTQKSDKNQNAHMPSSTPAMSQTIMPDNYEEGWYQDEYGNWLNQFDWKQVIFPNECPGLYRHRPGHLLGNYHNNQDEYGNWLNQFDWKQVIIKPN